MEVPLIKIDADAICIPEILERSFHMIKSENECVIYSRLDLVKENLTGRWLASAYRRPGDWWLIKNKNLNFINKKFVDQDGRFRAHEVLVKGKKTLICTECSWLHFPYEKQWRNDYRLDSLLLQEIQECLNSIPRWEVDPKYFNPKSIEKIAQSLSHSISNTQSTTCE